MVAQLDGAESSKYTALTGRPGRSRPSPHTFLHRLP
jgi:hypothetical protein